MNMKRLCATMGIVAALASAAHAEDAQWSQVTNLPKGLNVAPGATLSILGVQPGDTLDEVRPIVAELVKAHNPGPEMSDAQKRVAEYQGADLSPPLEEMVQTIMLPVGNSDTIELSYVGRIDLDRDLGDKRAIHDHLRVEFSAPSSGHQVIAATRILEYSRDEDQPRIGELVADLKARFGATPMVLGRGSTIYRWQFDNGSAVQKPDPGDNDCWPYVGDVNQEDRIAEINTRSGGDCDVVMEVRFVPGISDDHAASIIFTLSDNERGKANLTTDFAFFYDYVEKYRDGIGGEKPAL